MRRKKHYDYQPASIRRHATIAANADKNNLKREATTSAMKILIPIAIGVYWFWQPVSPYYFQQTYTVQKPEQHTTSWQDSSGGWRPADSR